MVSQVVGHAERKAQVQSSQHAAQMQTTTKTACNTDIERFRVVEYVQHVSEGYVK